MGDRFKAPVKLVGDYTVHLARVNGMKIANTLAMGLGLSCRIDTLHMLQERVEALSRTGREMHDDYLRFLEFREDADASQDWRW